MLSLFGLLPEKSNRTRRIIFDKIVDFFLSKVLFLYDLFITFGGLVPKWKDDDKDKEEYNTMRDLQDMILQNLRELKEKQAEETTNLETRLADILQNVKPNGKKDQQIIDAFESQFATYRDNNENQPTKDTIEQHLDDVKDKLKAQNEELQAQRKDIQQVVEMLNSMKSKESKTPRKKVRKSKLRANPIQKVQDTKLKSAPEHSFNDDNIIFNYISPDELSNKDQELTSLKQEIKKQRKENEKLVEILSKRKNETSDTSSEPGYYYFIE